MTQTMTSYYRCRAEIGDGSYVSYIGADLSAALDSMALHPYAHTVVVERMTYDGQWTDVVSGIWRNKETTNGLRTEARDVPAVVAGDRLAGGVGHP